MTGQVVDLVQKFGGLSDHWRPRVAAQLNRTRGVEHRTAADEEAR